MNFEYLKNLAETAASAGAAAIDARHEFLINLARAKEALKADEVDELKKIYGPDDLRQRTADLDAAIRASLARQNSEG